MTEKEVQKLHCGLYKIFWKDGGESLAAVGSNGEGKRWLAACNWISGASTEYWHNVLSVELIKSAHEEKENKVLYSQIFTRQNYDAKPPLKEVVVVIFRSEHETDSLEFEDDAFNALWEQYPIWNCPYNQSNPPTNSQERWRHSFSSPAIGEHQVLEGIQHG